jgi:hypothetical protein
MPTVHEIVSILFIAALVALAISCLRRPWNLRIIVRNGQVQVDGAAVGGRRADIVEFFRLELPEVHNARIEGRWDGRYLRTHFRGDLSLGQQQRLRNFLLTVL